MPNWVRHLVAVLIGAGTMIAAQVLHIPLIGTVGQTIGAAIDAPVDGSGGDM